MDECSLIRLLLKRGYIVKSKRLATELGISPYMVSRAIGKLRDKGLAEHYSSGKWRLKKVGARKYLRGEMRCSDCNFEEHCEKARAVICQAFVYWGDD